MILRGFGAGQHTRTTTVFRPGDAAGNNPASPSLDSHLNYGWSEPDDEKRHAHEPGGEVLGVKAQCLPFREIPHTTPLFADYLRYDPKVRPFYPHSPLLGEWAETQAANLHFDPTRREQIAAVLEHQNRQWGASAATLDSLARLRAGACVIVTGQQVGLFGGPLFALLKALSAVRLAAQVTATGHDCVPIFWLATEDHDLAEVQHTSIPGAKFELQPISVSPDHVPGAPVGSIRFGQEIEAAVNQVAGLLGDNEIVSALRESYRPGETFGSAFARLMTRIFAGRGLILLDPADAALHRVALPVYRKAIESAGDLDAALMARGKELERAGYHQQVKVTAASSLLFKLQNGARHVIRRKPNGPDEYLAGDERLTQNDLLAQIDASPELFSANVLLRPVMQDYLLPTLAYIGGTAEVAYFAQAAVVYEKLLGRVTPVLPRFSATLIEAKPQSLLERYHLQLPDLFQGPEPLAQTLGARTLPSDLQDAFASVDEKVTHEWVALRESLAHLDPTLAEASQRAQSKILYQMKRLHARAARAELRRSEVLARHAKLLSDALYPHKMLQERQVPGLYFLARYGLELLTHLSEALQPDCLDHQIISGL